jgi:hypothetical protein
MEEVIEYLDKLDVKDDSIVLLKNPDVIKWLFNGVDKIDEFRSITDKKYKSIKEKESAMKKAEDKWGKAIMKLKAPKLKFNNQWTNKFGEYLAIELYKLIGYENITKPIKMNGLLPDMEVEDYIIEVKTGTYYTSGTAHEKILGTPFKYADIPQLYGKPLKILCIGGAEMRCRNDYGNIKGKKTSKSRQKFLDFYKENGIEFISFTDILGDLIKSGKTSKSK